MAKRRGISLVELLLTMTACAVILTLSAELIHRMLHAQSRARAVQDGQRSAFRLERSFRNDVHQATRIQTTDAAKESLLVVQLPNSRTAEYRTSEAGIERLLLNGESVVSREAFAFPDETQFRVAQDRRLWTLSATSRQDLLTRHDVRVLLHIEAASHEGG